jgi:predicted alpha/beta superfamily hydrolase
MAGKTHDSQLDTPTSRIENFSFSANGKTMNGKIFLPASYTSVNELPAIYLIDFTEQHFKMATDEFDRVIEAVKKVQGLEAMVASLDGIPDVDAEPESYSEHYEVYRRMASYVDKNYKTSSSRTFLGKGSESGVVLMTLFMENAESSVFDNFVVTDPSPLYASAIIELIESNSFPKDKSKKKLHLSFSTSNNRDLCTALIKSIEKANYSWLQVATVEYSESNFENTYPIAYAAGIHFIFK